MPPELWKRGGAPLLTLLGRLFDAIGSTDTMPPGFLDGVITPIFKSGDGTLPSSYRPITLLNTDYRCLAKALSTRLSPALGSAIGPEQSAYLPKRRIGASIQLLLTLPHLMRAKFRASRRPARCAIALLDFKKAYDTVSRSFLLRIMQEAGAGDDLCFWASTLLSTTQAAACANGYTSAPLSYHAGVRQGCPLAPLLYLFVAWALSTWLQSQPGLGIEISPGRRHTAIQYADDTQVLLCDWSPATVQALLSAMTTFARASGQHLNTSKTRLLLVGCEGSDPPPSVCGLQCATHADALGCTVQSAHDAGSDRAQWDALLKRVQACFGRIHSRTHLSTFGRSHLAASYGVSTLLHRAEFQQVPAATADRLSSTFKTLVEKGSTDPQHRPPGVHSRLLVGKRADGGFGFLPLPQHCAARHAVWGRLFLEAFLRRPAARPAWADALAAQLSTQWPQAHPALLLLDLACSAGGQIEGDDPAGGPLLLISRGLRQLGRPTYVHTEAPGPWCAHIPVWCNPFLNLEVLTHPAVTQSRRARPLLEHPWSANPGHRPLRAMRDAGTNDAAPPYLPGVHTLGDLVRLHTAAQAALHLPAHLHPSTLFGPDTTITLAPATSGWITWILAVRPRLPEEWWHAAQVHIQEHPGFLDPRPWAAVLDAEEVSTAVRLMLSGVGWFEPLLPHLPPSASPPSHIPIAWNKSALTVRAGTRLQLAQPLAEQRTRRMRLVLDALALAQTAPGIPSAIDLFHTLHSGMRAVARCSWIPNHHLDTFWRLGLNGVPYAGGYDQPPHAAGCSCGWAGPPAGTASEPASRLWRSHVFGSCAVAQAVISAIVASMTQGAPPPAFAAPEVHLWLMHPPPLPSIHAGPWRVICLAAVTAMDFGRATLYRLSHPPPSQGPRPPSPPVSPVLAASRRAVARFWDLLLHATASRPTPPADWAGVGPSHPLLSIDPVGRFIRCKPPA